METSQEERKEETREQLAEQVKNVRKKGSGLAKVLLGAALAIGGYKVTNLAIAHLNSPERLRGIELSRMAETIKPASVGRPEVYNIDGKEVQIEKIGRDGVWYTKLSYENLVFHSCAGSRHFYRMEIHNGKNLVSYAEDELGQKIQDKYGDLIEKVYRERKKILEGIVDPKP